MRRAVITGMGIVSCLGNDKESVTHSLKNGISGIRRRDDFAEMGLRCNVGGLIDLDPKDHIDRKVLRFMGDSAAFGYIATDRAIADAGLSEELVTSLRTGLIMGSGGLSGEMFVEAVDVMRARGIKRAGPYRVTQIMASTVSACIATPFKIKGVNYSLSSACATSAHCIGHAVELIQLGKQDVLLAGGAEEMHWSMAAMFDAMGALTSKYNDTPSIASRAYDADRDGFAPSLGGGCVVVEELEHALARGANIICEVTGYGATSDGADMVSPSGEGAERCMKMAMETASGPMDYINTHGTSTPVGDVAELGAIRNTFGDSCPDISSTKSLSGHSLGAAGVHEAIYCMLMMENDFVAASAHIDSLDENASGLPILLETKQTKLNRIMSNSFGFGGTNASLVMEKYNG
ncbi:MAG: beta-ketoacyl-ACP synthase I [Porticoccaceae bacterium]|jgi:3-oxoacyl-[acyl-carrier-protein] synthase-1|nr:beta-ketoacyl-ACP synthase I [Porticoccaceae bacterium]MBT5071606.1 beta-ketoacyl-ACP synthase I [Porticoccaceae bacterium]MBT7947811.1 beta-ketoacyl-ACP synthase I [Porticoccaceae bacterium]MDB3884393.1 beta-ketoacyl-ACP synthase I [Porticoccaceae bacterium]MDC0370567.1 beta-ketoacyl-ACP synthase I [Porticoccaceae bacterium]|tara:strand:- start:7414 stop:8628 length:1215 start_codon:yes stop_codon:yes gene_type:complete